MKGEVKSEVSLKRALGLFTSTLLVIGLVIGSGVFKKIVPMAQTGLSEAAILLAWVLAGTITLFGALTVGALTTLAEESGGIYEYLQISPYWAYCLSLAVFQCTIIFKHQKNEQKSNFNHRRKFRNGQRNRKRTHSTRTYSLHCCKTH